MTSTQSKVEDIFGDVKNKYNISQDHINKIYKFPAKMMWI